MENQKLNSKNFLDYALQNYENPDCRDIDEFSEDVSRIKYLKRLFSRYEQDDDFKSRLIVNHLIVFNNVFGVVPSARILFHRIEEKYYSTLKTCLLFLDRLPSEIPELDLDQIPIDHKVLKKLKEEI